MLVIRLARTGRTKYPTYRIVAAESSRPATGRFVEVLGHYNPHTKELVVKHDETIKRMSQGAQPSNTVVKLLMREQLELPSWVKLKTRGNKAQVAEASSDVSAAEAESDATEPKSDAVSDSSDDATDKSEAPALHDATRVGTTVSEVADTAEPNVNDTERTETDDAAAANAIKAQDAAAKASGAQPSDSN